ncbi:MAG: exodeoxyribonuclease VII large subunit, partial [Bacteroidota bacterium]
PLPVLSGIGHEIDEVVLDKVAHKSLKTPTAVADFLLQHHLRFETQLLNTAAVVQQLTQQHIVRQQQQLQQLREQLRLSSQLPLVRAQQYIEQTAQQLPVIANRQVQQVRQQLRHWAQIVHLLSPDTTLRRGFAIIRQEDVPQSQLATLDDTRPITIEMQDGKLEVIRQIPKSEI